MELNLTPNLIGQDILSPFSEIGGDIAFIFLFLETTYFTCMPNFKSVAPANPSINSEQTNKQTNKQNH